jgi:hypothetical protein
MATARRPSVIVIERQLARAGIVVAALTLLVCLLMPQFAGDVSAATHPTSAGPHEALDIGVGLATTGMAMLGERCPLSSLLVTRVEAGSGTLPIIAEVILVLVVWPLLVHRLVVPKRFRPPGPTRQALLQCFRL